MSLPQLLALDFDGVVCDGLFEYFATAWRTYLQVWQPTVTVPPVGLAEDFYRLRPIIETGWEMPALIQALITATPEAVLQKQWQPLAHQLVLGQGLTPKALSTQLDRVRDAWIAEDLAGWLALHRFYPGILERIETTTIPVVIITTKEGRFVQQLLRQAGLAFNPQDIYGKECQQPKTQTLGQLLNHYADIWFVEDRLLTLQAVQAQADLDRVELFLADWGYNTPQDRQKAQTNPRMGCLDLKTFQEPFIRWQG